MNAGFRRGEAVRTAVRRLRRQDREGGNNDDGEEDNGRVVESWDISIMGQQCRSFLPRCSCCPTAAVLFPVITSGIAFFYYLPCVKVWVYYSSNKTITFVLVSTQLLISIRQQLFGISTTSLSSPEPRGLSGRTIHPPTSSSEAQPPPPPDSYRGSAADTD